MKNDIHDLKKSIEGKSEYAFEIKNILGSPSLKLLINSDRYEIYIELNKSRRTINPYLSFCLLQF